MRCEADIQLQHLRARQISKRKTVCQRLQNQNQDMRGRLVSASRCGRQLDSGPRDDGAAGCHRD